MIGPGTFWLQTFLGWGAGGGRWPIRRREGGEGCACSPADERGDDDTPGRAAAVGAGLLGVRVAAVRRLLVLAPAAAQPEGVKEEEEEVQAQAQQGHAAQQQHRLEAEGTPGLLMYSSTLHCTKGRSEGFT